MHVALKSAVDQLLASQNLSSTEMTDAIGAIMDGATSEAETASLLTALRIKGETPDELAGAARAMAARAEPITCSSQQLLDTCGTGGDNLHTFNISTAAAFVACGAGATVAKHGNRSVSSSSGSADVLEELGVNLELSPAQVGHCIDEIGIGFCFAPLFHGAMRHVVPVRRQLGFRTVFNLLGPLTNPTAAEFQVIGTGDIATARRLGAAVAQLDRTRVLVVCGNGELDEVSVWGATTVFRVENGSVAEESWMPSSFGLEESSVESLRVDSPSESADLIQRIFRGETGAPRDIVVANAAAALIASGRATAPQDAADLAASALDGGAARAKLEELRELSNSLSS